MEINLNRNGKLHKFNRKMWLMRNSGKWFDDYEGDPSRPWMKASRPKNLCQLFWHTVLNCIQGLILLLLMSVIAFIALSPFSMLINYLIDMPGPVLVIGALVSFMYLGLFCIVVIFGLAFYIKEDVIGQVDTDFITKGKLVEKGVIGGDEPKNPVYEDTLVSICYKFLANTKKKFCPMVNYGENND